MDYFFQTDSSEVLTAQKVERLLACLKFLSESQVKWLVDTLAPSTEVINPRQLEATMVKLKTSSTRSADMQRALIRLRKYIQEHLRISLMQAFSHISKGVLTLQRDSLREGLTRFAPQFPVTEIGMILSALYAEEESVSADIWVKVLCSAALPVEERRVPPRPVVPSKPLLLAAETNDVRYTSMSTFTRPITAPYLMAKSRLSNKLDNDCVSSTNWSETSSMKEPEELPQLMASAPGEKLVEAGRLLTNTAELGEARLVQKEMRSLGTHAYSGPGRHHEVLGEVEADGVVTVLETNGVWARVKCGQYEGWVPLCKLDEEVGRRLYSRHDNRLVPLAESQISLLSQVYVRKEPDWASQALAKVEAKPVRAVGVNADWVKVECDGGLRGWVPRQHTSMRGQTEELQSQVQQVVWNADDSTDLFHEYDRQTQSYFSSPSIARASLTSLKGVVQYKMNALGSQYEATLQHKLDTMAFRKRMVRNWLNLELSQGFHQWRKRVIATSKYEIYLQEKTQMLRSQHLKQTRTLAAKREAVRLRASTSAAALRLSLKQQETTLEQQRQERLTLLRTKASQDKLTRTQSLERSRMSVQLRNSASVQLLRQSLRVP